MSLEEKLIEVANSLKKEANRYPRMKTIDVVNMLINISQMEFDNPKQCVQICDEEIVKFAYWITDPRNENVKGSVTIEELLEIYKQGL